MSATDTTRVSRDTMVGAGAPGPVPSAFAPFRHRIFLAIWVANLASNFGSLIQGVGASWLMTTLAPSPAMVSLVQASTSLPIMLLSLTAGALADLRDRRRLMLVAQTFMLLVSAVLAALAYLQWLGPWTLLTFTFLIGCGAALNGPAWQSSVGDQVPRADLPGAIALNSLGFNLARATGPAIGGIIVATFSAAAAFLVNAISYVGLIVVLLRWRRQPAERPVLAPESLLPAMSAGLRYAALSPRIDRVLIRATVFGMSAAAVWSLLPIVARVRLGGGPLTYGLLLGAFGCGAVTGALSSARARHSVSNERLVATASVVFGAGAAIAGLSRSLPLTLVALLAAGACWVLTLSTLNTIVQMASPRWVVGRTMAVYQMATFGGLAAGSWWWGLVASHASLGVAMGAAGALLASSSLLGRWLRLPDQDAPDVEPSGAWGTPDVVLPVDHRSGPVITSLVYRVPIARHAAFVEAMHELRRVRRRDGARAWSLVQDMASPDQWEERFESPTWLDHLRLHARVTNADLEVERRVHVLLVDDTRPVVRHLIERHRAADVRGPAAAASASLVAPAVTDPTLPSGNDSAAVG